jgi:hypothetical protein
MLIITIMAMFVYLVLWSILLGIMGCPFTI